MARRWFKLAVACLLTGASTAIVIAWVGYNGRIGPVLSEKWEYTAPSGATWRLSTTNSWTRETIGLQCVAREPAATLDAVSTDVGAVDEHLIRDRVPPWNRWREHLASQAQQLRGVSGVTAWGFYAAGWPLRCLKGGVWLSHDSNTIPDRWGLVYVNLPVRGSTWLPILPVWSGFIVNTFVFGIVWTSLFTAGVSVRRHRRRRRGLCPLCAYELRGDFAAGCSECGWNRAGDRSARTSP